MVKQLKIDGSVTPAEIVAVLAQDDPFPGGHRVELELDVGTARRGFEHFPEHGELEPSRRESRSLLLTLGMLYMPQATGRLSHFINLVTRVRFAGTTVRIEGIASPVVRRGDNGQENRG